MTFEQLTIFVAVAERQHLTQAATAIGLTPSAVSTAIRNLEAFYRVELFHRVGRRIELTSVGRAFLVEAKAMLARVKAAELALAEFGSLQRGELSICASQTVASYWLPPVLMRFHQDYPGIDLKLSIGNTTTVAQAVHDGTAEMGFVEGEIDDPALAIRRIVEDVMLVVVGPKHPWADGRSLTIEHLVSDTSWVLREEGSGTRSILEKVLADRGVRPKDLKIVLEFPSNEAVLSAVRAGTSATVVSGIAAMPLLQQSLLFKAGFDLPSRFFSLLRHKERHQSKAAAALETLSHRMAAER